jgi:hypothetical protein
MFEGYLFNGTGALQHLLHLAQVFRARAMANLGNVEAAAELLFARSRAKIYWSNDPYLYYYHYCYSTVLRRLGANRLDDADTILGKVIKIFQERGSRIEDPVHKQSFLRQRHWNSELLADARERNLV